MESEPIDESVAGAGPEFASLAQAALPEKPGVGWLFMGEEGLRAGWAAGLFMALTAIFYVALQILNAMVGLVRMQSFTPRTALAEKLMEVGAVALATLLMARLEDLRADQMYLGGKSRAKRLAEGLVVGFGSLAALMGALAAGGWIQVGGPGLSWLTIAQYGVLWGLVFLATGLAEEGAFRCYLQRTLARGVNFWWALSAVAVLCALAALRGGAHGAWGIYAAALLGLAPCLLLHLRKGADRFWQAAWVTSTFFGFWHLGNSSESGSGIFAAALAGFVFCASVRLTGSIWWAVGWHAAWDWSETFFWGAADSGLPARGHFLSVTPQGNPLWSGGAVGPEGSLLAPLVLLLLLGGMAVVYGRKASQHFSPSSEHGL